MSVDPANEAPQPVIPPPAPRPRSTGFLSRFLAAVLVVIITTFLALVGVAVAYTNLGYSLATPAELADARAQIQTIEAQNTELQAQSSLLQTQVLDTARRSADTRETLDDLRREVSGLSDLRSQLRDQFTTSARENATMVADARASRDAVALFATTEADRAILLQELRRRSDRIERFLQRLSDIAGDAALDISAETTVSPVLMTSTAGVVLTPTATSAPTVTPSATTSPTPTIPPATRTPTPQPTPTTTATPAP